MHVCMYVCIYTYTHTHICIYVHTHSLTHTRMWPDQQVNGNTAPSLYASRTSLYGSRTLETMYGSHSGWYGSVRSNYMGMSASIIKPGQPEPAETGPSGNYI